MMAEITPQQAALMQSRLGQQHRIDLAAISRLTQREVRELLLAIMGEDDRAFARIIRQAVPEIINKQGVLAAGLAAAYFDQSRGIYIASGQAPRNAGNFVANTADFMKSPVPGKLAVSAVDEMGYWIGNSITGKFTRQQTVTPIAQITQKAVLGHSRELIEVNSKADAIAKNEPNVVVKPDGCDFCKYMAVFKGGEKFHNGCGCGNQPAWTNEVVDVPEWVEGFEEKYDKAYKKIMEDNKGKSNKEATSMTRNNILKAMREVEKV